MRIKMRTDKIHRHAKQNKTHAIFYEQTQKVHFCCDVQGEDSN